ncbi:MAG TPA: NAD(P)-dependent oxidoreductase, partial [Verrucomicrobiaceae bacterium]
MPKIVISIPIKADVLRRVEALPEAKVVVTEHVETAGATLPTEVIADATLLVCKLPPANHAEMSALKLVQLSSVGFTQLAPLQLVSRGIRACNARGVYDTAIAEWTIAMLVNLVRDVRGMMRHQDQGIWDRNERFCGEIRGRVLGIWGYGGIGRETARLAKALGLTVHVMARRKPGRRDDSYVVAGTGDPDGSLPDLVFATG